jgi:hypothetical protein
MLSQQRAAADAACAEGVHDFGAVLRAELTGLSRGMTYSLDTVIQPPRVSVRGFVARACRNCGESE